MKLIGPLVIFLAALLIAGSFFYRDRGAQASDTDMRRWDAIDQNFRLADSRDKELFNIITGLQKEFEEYKEKHS